jgi:hypothetical protein
VEESNTLAIADRLWQLVVTLETLIPFGDHTHPGSPLNPADRKRYAEAIDGAAETGMLGAGDIEALRHTLSTWQSQSPLVREILSAIIGDINTFRSDSVALQKAVMLLSRRRGRP